MKIILGLALLGAVTALESQTQLTVYNQNFAAVKEQRVLDLKSGINEVRLSDITAHLEPDSVILRTLGAGGPVRILEQDYEGDPLSEGLLLLKSEGKVLNFETTVPQTGEKRIVKGRILRSGYVPHTQASQWNNAPYAARQYANASPQGGGQPIVEVDGKVQFGLPGRPLFEPLEDGAFLKPTLLWRLSAERAGPHRTEFSYLTGGMRWQATYNAIAQETGDMFDLTGWVTLENMSGKDFENASIKLMAGDVARAPGQNQPQAQLAVSGSFGGGLPQSPVTERPFDDYHLYTLTRPATLLDREIKQVEFVRAANVAAKRFYVYDGLAPDRRFGGDEYNFRNQAGYGTLWNTKIWVMLEFKNSEAAHLGMPLPKGMVKLYRRDSDGHNEFIGEDQIDHTPKDETARLRTGNAFDIVGERRQTSFYLTNANMRQAVDETFEIKIRNHKSEAAEIRVVEHMYRGINWEIRSKSMDFTQTDARTIELRPQVAANGAAVIRYTVHYEW